MSANPPAEHPKLKAARRLLEQGKPKQALQHCATIYEQFPNAVNALLLASEAHECLGNYGDMLGAARQAVATRPRNVDARLRLAHCLLISGQIDQALDTAKSIEHGALVNQRAGAMRRAAQLYERLSQPDAARRCWQQAVELAPDKSEVLLGASLNALQQGYTRSAASTLDRLIFIQPDNAKAWYWRLQCISRNKEINYINKLAYLINNIDYITDDNLGIYLAMARGLDELSRFSDAAELLGRTAAVSDSPASVLNQELSKLQALPGAFSLDTSRQVAPMPDTLKKAIQQPIFVTGMPGSGAPLVTALLCQHPVVEAGGENAASEAGLTTSDQQSMADLSGSSLLHDSVKAVMARQGQTCPWQECWRELDIDDLRQDYLQRGNSLSHGAKSWLDGAADNWAYCGLIHQALPEARVVYVHRHPLDNALNLLRSLPGDLLPCAINGEDTGRLVGHHERLRNHWKAYLGAQLLLVDYDLLLLEPARQLQRITRFLDWEDNARIATPLLPSHAPETALEQRIERLQRQLPGGRWRRYEALLKPVREALDSTFDGTLS